MVKIQKKSIRNIFQRALDLNLTPQIVHEYVVKLYPNNDGVFIVAIGKSASAMLEGAVIALEHRFNSALLITKDNPIEGSILCNHKIQVILAGHPIPDETSLIAGHNLIQFVDGLQKNDQLLFLISGGTSALVEYIPDAILEFISIDELQELNKWLLASDKNIVEMNNIRKTISGIKAGRLLDYIDCVNVNALYISDVPDDDLKNIGSGLLVAEELSFDFTKLPVWVERLIKKTKKIPGLKTNTTDLITSHIIFSNTQLRTSLVDVAVLDGYTVTNMDAFISGNTQLEANRIGEWLKKQKPGVYIWGAETHMMLPECPGRGGRNQTFALALAMNLQGISNVVVLLAGTDGNDGNTNDAGAIIDGGTTKRGEHHGLSASLCLANANAGEFLFASGDILTLGVTGTNVMDIIMALIWD